MQGLLLWQVVWHWVWTSTTFAVVICLCQVGPAWLSGTEDQTGQIWYHLGPFFLASVVLFPIIVASSIRFSHRFAGPMVRVRRYLKSIARGESLPPLKLRDGDHWMELADDINGVTALISRLRESEDENDNSEELVCAASGTVSVLELPTKKDSVKSRQNTDDALIVSFDKSFHVALPT